MRFGSEKPPSCTRFSSNSLLTLTGKIFRKIGTFRRINRECTFSARPPYSLTVCEIGGHSHQLREKEPLIHCRDVARNRRPEIHMGQDVPLNIDTGSDFDQLKAVGRGFKHRSFGHEQRGAALSHREFGVVANLFNRPDELAMPAFPDDPELAVLENNLQPAS